MFNPDYWFVVWEIVVSIFLSISFVLGLISLFVIFPGTDMYGAKIFDKETYDHKKSSFHPFSLLISIPIALCLALQYVEWLESGDTIFTTGHWKIFLTSVVVIFFSVAEINFGVAINWIKKPFKSKKSRLRWERFKYFLEEL